MNNQRKNRLKNSELWGRIENPPGEYGPVPFYWWSGEKLIKERLLWQLERLEAKGIAGFNVNYIHTVDGAAEPGYPPYFSEEWWEIWKWFVGECSKCGMAVGFDDYLVTFALKGMIGKGIIEENTGIYGRYLKCTTVKTEKEKQVRLELNENEEFVCCRAYHNERSIIQPEGGLDISPLFEMNGICWTPPEGEWLVCFVSSSKGGGMNPLDPELARQTIKRYFENFERATPRELGKGVNFFFQDELNFRMKWPFWDRIIIDEFKKRKGYDIMDVLPALFINIGDRTPKVRMDYNDVMVSLMEKNYFIPIYNWVTERGILYGCDQSARGNVGMGFDFYGDYFRTIRWFSAPGSDDPLLSSKRRLFRGKVASSISHMYKRPRTWVEAYHSTGWGISPAELVSYTNQNFMYGYNLLNLHGLYYSTFGGWFEWAPPDFHFRQPYWEHMDVFNLYYTRLAFIMTRGVHCCDAAIIYPTSPFEAGMDGEIAEQACNDIGDMLYFNGIDFDYIDEQSVEGAEAISGELYAAGERYRVLILPAMKAVRYKTIEKVLEFYEKGGVVIVYGCLPEASDRVGRNDDRLSGILSEIFDRKGGRGNGVFIPSGCENINRTIDRLIERDFLCNTEGITSLHRHADGIDFYAVCNQSEVKETFKCSFKQGRKPFAIDLVNYKFFDIGNVNSENERIQIELTLEPFEIRMVVFGDEDSYPALLQPEIVNKEIEVKELGNVWESRIEPLLDNTWGDFRLPAIKKMIGPEARQFLFSEALEEGWFEPAFDDTSWERCTYTFGPRLLKLGPIPSETSEEELKALERILLKKHNVFNGDEIVVSGCTYTWGNYEFSEKWGIEKDPLLLSPRTGPHGLKKRVPDEFIDVTCDNIGDIVYMWTKVISPCIGEYELVASGRSAYDIYLNGEKALSQPVGLPAAFYPPYNLPDYRAPEQKIMVTLNKGENILAIKCIQLENQRLRLYMVVEPVGTAGKAEPDELSEKEPALQWFKNRKCLPLNVEPSKRGKCGFYRFLSPPGMKYMKVAVAGELKKAYIGGVKAFIEAVGMANPGIGEYKIMPAGGLLSECTTVAFCIGYSEGNYGGAVFNSPVEFFCGEGVIRNGDWSAYGLSSYSGGVWYGKKIEIGRNDLEKRAFLDLGDVRVTARVLVNGVNVHTLIASPWKCEITDYLKVGENEIRIHVTNTLANHYSVEIPTGFIFEGQTVSGLMGPVKLEIC